MSRKRDTFPCPACGEVVPAGALACKACGADEKTGWAEDDAETTTQELGLERHLDDERYEDFVREDLEGGKIETDGPTAYGFWFVVAGVAALAILLAWLTAGKSPR